MPLTAYAPLGPHRLGWRHVADAALLALLACVVLLASMNRAINLFDEGIILVGASRVAHGDMIHRDFYTLYGPANYYIVAALFKLFGPSVLAERLWDTAVKMIAVVLVYLIGLQSSGRRLALAAALLCIPWLAAFRFYNYPLYPALTSALGCLLFMLPVLRGRTEARFRTLSGLCAGVACLFRYDMGLFVGAAVGGTSALFLVRNVRPATRLAAGLPRALAPFLGGIAIVLVPLAIAYLAEGAARGFVFDLIVVPPTNAVMRSLPFPGLTALLSQPVELSVYFPLLTCAAALLAVARPRFDPDCGPAIGAVGRWTLLLLVVTTLVLWAKGLARVSSLHMGAGIIASFTVLAMLLAVWSASRGLTRTLTVLAVAATFTATWPAANSVADYARANWTWLRHGNAFAAGGADPLSANGSCNVAPELAQMRCFLAPGEDLQVVAWLRDRLPVNSRLFVGAGRHDKIFANDIALYFLAGMQPLTHWHNYDPGVQNSAPVQQDMVRELEAWQPPYIVIDPRFDRVIEPNRSALSSGVTILDRYIADHYEPDATFGPLAAWKRRANPVVRP
jgi:hypothetical protein